MNIERPPEVKDSYLEHLDFLYKEGSAVAGALRSLNAHFGITEKTAQEALWFWMNSRQESKPPPR